MTHFIGGAAYQGGLGDLESEYLGSVKGTEQTGGHFRGLFNNSGRAEGRKYLVIATGLEANQDPTLTSLTVNSQAADQLIQRLDNECNAAIHWIAFPTDNSVIVDVYYSNNPDPDAQGIALYAVYNLKHMESVDTAFDSFDQGTESIDLPLDTTDRSISICSAMFDRADPGEVTWTNATRDANRGLSNNLFTTAHYNSTAQETKRAISAQGGDPGSVNATGVGVTIR